MKALKIKPQKSAKVILMKALPHLLEACGFGGFQKLILSEADKRLTENQARIVLDILKVMLEEW